MAKKPSAPKEPSTFQIGWAIHQMKRDVEYRNVVVARPGHTIVEFDAAGQEYRWMAIASGDPTMLKLCTGDEDPHSFMATQMDTAFEYRELMEVVADKTHPRFREAREIRQGGKVGNLSLQYRTSPKTYYIRARVDYGMTITMKQAEFGYFIYHKTYPGVKRFWAKAIAKAQACGYAETFAGRRIQLQGDWANRDKWQLESTSINYQIQGTGADQKYLAMSTLAPHIEEAGARFMLDLHDGIYLEVPDNKAEKFCRAGKQALDDLPYTKAWGFTPPIPLPFDVKAGKAWGELKEVKL
jgi:DNA polymerase-1